MSSRDLGSWILPQPRSKKRYIKIPYLQQYNITIPFGYEPDEEDPMWLKPIPTQLEALDLARKHLKKYTYKAVAAWLSKQTGRSITAMGLSRRLKNDTGYRRKASIYRALAKRYYHALERAKHFESLCNKEDKTEFFETDYYVQLSRSFDEEFNRDTKDTRKRKHRVQAQSGATDDVSGSART
jgi:hypothetical protein